MLSHKTAPKTFPKVMTNESGRIIELGTTSQPWRTVSRLPHESRKVRGRRHFGVGYLKMNDWYHEVESGETCIASRNI